MGGVFVPSFFIKENYMEFYYIELNHWSSEYYPDIEPFLTWMSEDILQFRNEEWLKENKLVVVESIVDMSLNYCITASREWIDKYCPELLTKYSKFLRKSNEDGEILGQFGCPFLPYKEENFGYWYAGWDEDEWIPKRLDKESE